MDEQLSVFDLGEIQTDNLVQFPIQKPCKPVNYHKGQSQTVYPIKEPEQRAAVAKWLLDHKNRYYYLAFTLGINLGLRANELLALRYGDLFFPDGNIRYIPGNFADTVDMLPIFQSKTAKFRGLWLNEDCVNVLNLYCDGMKRSEKARGAYIFRSREMRPLYDKDGKLLKENVRDVDGRCHITVGACRKALKEAAKACGIKQNVGTHTLRKTFGYLHYQQYHDIEFLQALFGHSSQLITFRYIGMADEEYKKAYHSVSADLAHLLAEKLSASG